MKESKQMVLELDACRTENANLKAALQTAERLLGQRDMQLAGSGFIGMDMARGPDMTAEYVVLAHSDGTISEIKPSPERRPVIWPEPGKIPFDLDRLYDPMSLSNRDKPLNLSNHRDTPRRRRTDCEREAED